MSQQQQAASMECSMCGDVGFSAQLFQCVKCHSRFQHSYCSKSFFGGAAYKDQARFCDWCLVDAEPKISKAGREVETNNNNCKKRTRVHISSSSAYHDSHNKQFRKKAYSNQETVKAAKISERSAAASTGSTIQLHQNCLSRRTKFPSRVRRRFRPLHEILC